MSEPNTEQPSGLPELLRDMVDRMRAVVRVSDGQAQRNAKGWADELDRALAGAPTSGDVQQLEELALIIESLLEELRRRGASLDFDLSSYEEYRAQNPRKDA